MKIRQALIIPDCHVPYEDKTAYNLMLECADDMENLYEIDILGDYADFYNVNFHGKSSDIQESLKDEVLIVRTKLGEIRKRYPKVKINFIEGNHCFRLNRYLQEKCPDLIGIIDLYSTLNLEKLGINLIPYGPHQKFNVLGTSLIAKHEPIGSGVNPCHATTMQAGGSVIFGHTHRISEWHTTNLEGHQICGINAGWLGDKNHPVFSYVKNFHKWQLGFCTITTLEDNSWYHQLVKIIEKNGTYRCLFNGQLYEEKK